MAVVKYDGQAIMIASEDLKIYREIFMAAVNQHGGGLRFSSECLQRDR